MTLKEIREKVRLLLSDEVGGSTAGYWTDPELNEYINASIEELCERTLCVTDSLTDAVCLISLVANQKHYPLHAAILDISTVQPSWRQSPLSKQSVTTVSPGWLSNVGLPDSYLVDYSNRTLSLTSAPATVTTESIRLTAQVLPVTELSAASDTPITPRQYHRRIYDGVLAKAFSKQDSEIYKPEKATKHQDKWEKSLEEIIRREARLKPRIIIARRVEMS